MSRIVNNSILNGIALAATAIMSLLLVPALIRTYGLEDYGLVPLVRLLTPLGALSIFTFGLPAMATRHAAHDQIGAGRICGSSATQSTILMIGAVLGFCVSLVMVALGYDRTASLFNVSAPQSLMFDHAYRWLIVAMPLLFMGMLSINILIGLEHFLPLRMIEVFGYVIYFVVALAIAWTDGPIVYVILAMIALDLLKALSLLFYLWMVGSIDLKVMVRPQLSLIGRQFKDLRVLAAASLLSYGKVFLPPVILPLLGGPAALGLYDAAARIPRAFKAVQALVSNAVMPRALRIDAADETERLRLLVTRGTRLMLLFVLPPALAMIVYADPIMATWLGDKRSPLGLYLSLLMVPWTLAATLALLTAASIGRIELMARLNRANLLEIISFLLLLWLLWGPFRETAVYLAVAVSAALGYLIKCPICLDSFAIELAVWRRLVGQVALSALVGILLVLLPLEAGGMAAPWLQLASLPLAMMLSVLAALWLWSPGERHDLKVVWQSLTSWVPWQVGKSVNR